MAHWTAPTFLDTWKGRLEARAGMTGVKVFTAPPGDEMPASDGIWVDRIATTEEWAAIDSTTRPRHETYDVKCGLYVIKAGAGGTVWGASLARAAAILAEIEDDLTGSGTTGQAAYNQLLIAATGVELFAVELAHWETDQSANPMGRDVLINFTLRCQARKP